MTLKEPSYLRAEQRFKLMFKPSYLGFEASDAGVWRVVARGEGYEIKLDLSVPITSGVPDLRSLGDGWFEWSISRRIV